MNNQDIVYAKSEPIQTLKDHTQTLLKNLKILRKAYGEKIECRVPLEYRNIFWDILSLVVKYHDLGKVSVNFQNEIRKRLGLSLLPVSIEKDIQHNFISPAFLGDDIFDHEKEIIKTIVQSIVFHHERRKLPSFSEIEMVIKVDIEERKYLVKDIINVPDTFWTGYERFYKERIKPRDKVYPLYILVKGLLHRLDHASSALVDVEIKDDCLTEKVLGFLWYKGNLRPLQEYIKNRQDENFIIIGSTGIGKTEAGLLWAGKEKTFFTLPIRVTVNAIFDRIFNEIGYKNCGLLHSSSLDYLEYAGYETPFEIYKNSKQLSYQLSVLTIDQLFTFPFKYGGYEKILSTLLYSKIIIDEIQSYEPKIAAIILKGLREISNLGGKFLIMTATLPQIYLDYLKEWNVSFEYKEFFDDRERHRIKVENSNIINSIDEMLFNANKKKVLVIVNTIKKAKEIFRAIKGRGFNPKMLHSLYILEDRKRLEKEIEDFAKSKEGGLWIATQIVEASLDIDFDLLYTELSTVDSFFQRMGRVYRSRKYNGEEPNIYVFTDECSGIGTVYDRDIFDLSKQSIENFDGKLIQELDKVAIVKDVYSKEKLAKTKYMEEFKKAIQILENIMEYELSKNDAHSILRDIYSIRAIPINIYEKYLDEINKITKILKISKNKEERLENERFLNDKLVDIPYFRIRRAKNTLMPLDSLKGIYIVNYKYCPEEGLLFDEVLSNFI